MSQSGGITGTDNSLEVILKLCPNVDLMVPQEFRDCLDYIRNSNRESQDTYCLPF